MGRRHAMRTMSEPRGYPASYLACTAPARLYPRLYPESSPHLKRGMRPVMAEKRLVMAATTESMRTSRWCAPTCGGAQHRRSGGGRVGSGEPMRAPRWRAPTCCEGDRGRLGKG